MFDTILVLAPHTDDGELGCGGTMDRLVKGGTDVHYAAFSTAEKSVPAGCPADTLKNEVKDAMKLLGIRENLLHIFNYEVRYFFKSRQDILEDMIKLNSVLKPQLVLMPGMNDIHQDHKVIALEGLRAFKNTSILTYELPWNNILHDTCRFFVKLDEENIINKLRALGCYKSQREKIYFKEDFIRSLAVVRGTQIGTQYAEAFNVARWIL